MVLLDDTSVSRYLFCIVGILQTRTLSIQEIHGIQYTVGYKFPLLGKVKRFQVSMFYAL